MVFPFLKLKLGSKLALIYIILGFLTLLATNLIWLLPSLSEIKQNAAALQLEIAKKGAKEIESFVEYKLDSFYKLTYFLDPQGSLEFQKSVFERFLRKDQAFFELALIDEQGQEKIKVSQFEIFTPDDLINQSLQGYFKKAIQGDNYISEVFFSEKAEPFLILATPIYSFQREVSGVLAAKLNLREMWQVTSGLKVGQSSHAFVVDDKGRLIADPNPSLVLKNLILLNLEPVRKVVEDRRIVTGLEEEDRYLDERNQWVLAVAVPLEKLPWGLIIERPEQEAYAGLAEKFIAFILISIFGGAALFLIGRWVSNYLIGPLRRLGEGAKIIGSGELNFKLDIKTGDEIEDLAKAFNEMTERLKESYLYLGRKVEERTGELKIQRDRLDEVAKKLIQRDIDLSQTKEKQERALIEATEAKKKAEEARVATLNILEDVEEARQAQEIEKNKVEAVIRSLTDGLIMLDEGGGMALINRQAEIMLNIKKEDIIGQELEEIQTPEFNKLTELIKSGKGQLDKEEMTLTQPEERVLEVSTASVLDLDGEIIGKVIILHDVTREKAIEKMKSEFVSIAAHQLRTPLSAVKWSLRLILDHDLGPISKDQEQILLKGYQSNERMINLVNDLLNVARIEEGRFVYKLSDVSFSDLIEEAFDGFQPLIRSKNLKIKFAKPKIICLIKADKEKMLLALQNLIENAVNYSLSGGLVTISFDCDKMNLNFAIKDNGMGIPKHQQPRIFSKFFRGDNAVKMETEGTGLGLFITKNIIESHGGKTWFESEEKKGSTFYFTLPILKIKK